MKSFFLSGLVASVEMQLAYMYHSGHSKKARREMDRDFNDRGIGLYSSTSGILKMTKSKKRIVFIIPSLVGGGAEKSVLVLATQLSKLGHEVHIILFLNHIEHETSDRYKIHFLTKRGRISKSRHIRNMVLAHLLKKKLKEIERNGKVDLIVSNMHTASQVAVKLNSDNVYFTVRNTMSRDLELKYKENPRKVRRKKRRLQRLYDHRKVIVISKGLGDDVIHNFGCKNADIRLIYNGFDIEDIRERSREKSPLQLDCDYILHIGRFDRQKRHDILFKAFKRIKADLKLVLLAKPTEELIDLIRRERLEDEVILPGFQRNPYPIIRNARLLVLSSDYEGLPRVIVEALACGTPVVSTNCPSGPAEILTGEYTRWLVPCGDDQALAEKIDEALNTTIKIDEEILEPFDVRRCAQEHLNLID